ncbi:MAG: hypothetical protein MHM6MM_007177 [Cercozoa sp. M6MM]
MSDQVGKNTWHVYGHKLRSCATVCLAALSHALSSNLRSSLLSLGADMEWRGVSLHRTPEQELDDVVRLQADWREDPHGMLDRVHSASVAFGVPQALSLRHALHFLDQDLDQVQDQLDQDQNDTDWTDASTLPSEVAPAVDIDASDELLLRVAQMLSTDTAFFKSLSSEQAEQELDVLRTVSTSLRRRALQRRDPARRDFMPLLTALFAADMRLTAQMVDCLTALDDSEAASAADSTSADSVATLHFWTPLLQDALTQRGAAALQVSLTETTPLERHEFAPPVFVQPVHQLGARHFPLGAGMHSDVAKHQRERSLNLTDRDIAAANALQPMGTTLLGTSSHNHALLRRAAIDAIQAIGDTPVSKLPLRERLAHCQEVIERVVALVPEAFAGDFQRELWERVGYAVLHSPDSESHVSDDDIRQWLHAFESARGANGAFLVRPVAVWPVVPLLLSRVRAAESDARVVHQVARMLVELHEWAREDRSFMPSRWLDSDSLVVALKTPSLCAAILHDTDLRARMLLTFGIDPVELKAASTAVAPDVDVCAMSSDELRDMDNATLNKLLLLTLASMEKASPLRAEDFADIVAAQEEAPATPVLNHSGGDDLLVDLSHFSRVWQQHGDIAATSLQLTSVPAAVADVDTDVADVANNEHGFDVYDALSYVRADGALRAVPTVPTGLRDAQADDDLRSMLWSRSADETFTGNDAAVTSLVDDWRATKEGRCVPSDVADYLAANTAFTGRTGGSLSFCIVKASARNAETSLARDLAGGGLTWHDFADAERAVPELVRRLLRKDSVQTVKELLRRVWTDLPATGYGSAFVESMCAAVHESACEQDTVRLLLCDATAALCGFPELACAVPVPPASDSVFDDGEEAHLPDVQSLCYELHQYAVQQQQQEQQSPIQWLDALSLSARADSSDRSDAELLARLQRVLSCPDLAGMPQRQLHALLDASLAVLRALSSSSWRTSAGLGTARAIAQLASSINVSNSAGDGVHNDFDDSEVDRIRVSSTELSRLCGLVSPVDALRVCTVVECADTASLQLALQAARSALQDFGEPESLLHAIDVVNRAVQHIQSSQPSDEVGDLCFELKEVLACLMTSWSSHPVVVSTFSELPWADLEMAASAHKRDGTVRSSNNMDETSSVDNPWPASEHYSPWAMPVDSSHRLFVPE